MRRLLVPIVAIAWGLGCSSGSDAPVPECPVVWNGQTVVSCIPGQSNPKTGCPTGGCVDPHAAGWLSVHDTYACVEAGRLCSACHTTAQTGPGALCALCHGPGLAPAPPCSF